MHAPIFKITFPKEAKKKKVVRVSSQFIILQRIHVGHSKIVPEDAPELSVFFDASFILYKASSKWFYCIFPFRSLLLGL